LLLAVGFAVVLAAVLVFVPRLGDTPGDGMHAGGGSGLTASDAAARAGSPSQARAQAQARPQAALPGEGGASPGTAQGEGSGGSSGGASGGAAAGSAVAGGTAAGATVTGDGGGQPASAAQPPQGPVLPPDLPARSITIWQSNSRNVQVGSRWTSVFEFAISTRGSPLGVLEDIVIETNAGTILVPGPMDGTAEGGYRTAELETEVAVYAFYVRSATATVYGMPGQDILPYLRVEDIQPRPILLPDDPESVLEAVRYFEISKFLADVPIDFGSSLGRAPILYPPDLVEAAVLTYRDLEGVNIMVWNGATLMDRPVEGPYIVLFNRDGVNGFSVMEPSPEGFANDRAVFTFSYRAVKHPDTGVPFGAEPEVTVNGQRQDLDYAVRNNAIMYRAFYG
jgi:hypothetical protein